MSLPSGSAGDAASQDVYFGSNHLSVTGDLVVLHDKQSWDLEAMRELLALLTQVRAMHGRVYTISFVHVSGEATGEARRLLSHWYRANEIDLVTFVGAGIAIRGLLALIQGSIRLLSGRLMKIRFCKTFEEAQALVAAARDRR